MTIPPLTGLRVLDLSRILAGPTCTQLLSDLGAEVIKIERPGSGDDTRGWGPPFLQDADGNDTRESAYYLCANRGKKSVALDISAPEGRAIILDIAKTADILVENFKVGGLSKYSLDYPSLKDLNPGLIYCSITGFGQNGPLAHRAGYDFLIQGMGGIMSLTGTADGQPMKTGVGIADVMCGMYASSAILAALHHRTATGQGQHIDLGLLDSQVSWLINQGTGYLTDRQTPPRRGNEHPTIVPYGTFPASDRDFILAVGNDRQFTTFCQVADIPHIATDPRFARNVDRVRNRDILIPLLGQTTRTRPADTWIAALDDKAVPCGPIQDLADVFDHPQVRHRNMEITLPHPIAGEVSLIGNPIRMSETPVTYQNAPPMLGEHTDDVLAEFLSDDDRDALAAKGVLGRLS